MNAAERAEPLLRLRGVTKRYAVPVLTDVDFELSAGEVHALMGANGAGKTTLSRIICGLTPADEGRMTLAGVEYAPGGRRDADRAGVQLVMQELNLIPTLSVAENLFLSELPNRFGFVSSRALLARAAHALAAVGLTDLDPRTPVSRLGVGHQQLVEIAAALARPCRVLVLDEPTAALTDPEVALLFTQLRRLRASGTAIIYVSHRLEEIREIGDRITVLRDGRVVATQPAAETSIDDLVRLMTGDRAPDAQGPGAHARGETALRVSGLTRGTRVRNVSFEVAAGEILGLAGLVGSGRTETLRAVFGADLPDAGAVMRGGSTPLAIRRPSDAVRAGIGMIPEDRKSQAILLSQPVRANMTLAALRTCTRAGWWIDRASETRAAEGLRVRLDVRARSLDQPAGELSGGNQQKVVMGRWLLRDCDVLLFDEPTRGIDVASRAAVHGLLHELAARGKALVVVSSDLPELMALCDRIGVLSAGRLVATFARAEYTQERIMAAAFSGYAAGRGAASS